MSRALALAERGLGETNPNPAVGCVLVRGRLVVGEGFHSRAGSPHAEAMALDQAGKKARGATAYITLEPCAPHPGKRTPPCGPRLIEAGVSRVVFGVRDLNPAVRGASIRALRSAGVLVVEGAGGEECRRITRHFNTAMRYQRPFVSLKAGMTLDGRTATASGESKWITSRKQRAAARSLRRLFDGVLVGIETALKDDPLLLPVPRTRRPYVRVVLDSHLRLPLHSRLVQTARRSPLIVVGALGDLRKQDSLEARGVTVLLAPGSGSRVSISKTLAALFARGLTSLMVEGGSEVLGSFVRERLFDEIVIFRAPWIMGGRGSRSVVGGDDLVNLGEGVGLTRTSIHESATLRYFLPDAASLDVEVYEPRKDATHGLPRLPSGAVR